MTNLSDKELKIIGEEFDLFDNLINNIFSLFNCTPTKEQKDELEQIILNYENNMSNKELELRQLRNKNTETA